jgi:uncharacterized protein (DUF2236 family)
MTDSPAGRQRDNDGLYGPGSEAWRLNRDAMLVLGAGPRALLLQVAHPLVAEGVDQHSDFRADPWARLWNTIRSYLTIVYGTGTAARAEIRRLNGLHRSIGGHVADPAARAAHGATYTARDQDLALWVHATLVDSTIVAYDAWIEPLGRDRRARYYAETLPIGRAFGIGAERLPPDLEAFVAYMDGMLAPDGPIHPTATARELARSILHPPLAPLAPWLPGLARVPTALYDWTAWPAVALLPPRICEEYGLRWGPGQAMVARWLVAGFRLWRPRIATNLRWMAAARAADARTAGVARQ